MNKDYRKTYPSERTLISFFNYRLADPKLIEDHNIACMPCLDKRDRIAALAALRRASFMVEPARIP